MQKSLVIKITPEEREKKALQKTLEKKQRVLSEWMEKVEELRLALDLIKNEYNVRIGLLLLKDNQLDLEIIRYRNLKRLMDEGLSYEEAVRREEDTTYNEILRLQMEQERLAEKEKLLHERVEVSEEVQENIKAIWKKLIRKFHPDLTTNPEEKEHRTALMTQINNAYSENNIDALIEFEHLQVVSSEKDLSLERLQQMLVALENMIADWRVQLISLKKSEWYVWKEKLDKAKGKKEDIFATLERKLLDDIVKKIEILQELRKQVENR